MILSGSVHAMVNALIKGQAGQTTNRMAQMALTSGASTFIALPFLPFVDLPDGAWGWLAIAMGVHIVYFVCLVRALDAGDLSSAYPVFRGSAPLITLAGSVLIFGEALHQIEIIGTLMIIAGVLVMLKGRHLDRPTLGWSLATGLLIAAYTIIDAQGVRAAPNAASFIVWLFFLMGFVSMLVLPLFVKGSVAEAARNQWKSALLAGFLSVITFGTALYALSMGPTAPLAALRETGMVTALLISIFVLKEPVTTGKIAAILTICAGALVLLGSAA